MVEGLETNTSFDEAITHVIAALQPLGEQYTSTLEQGLRRGRWCDRYETKGKRSGAFSSGSYGNPPLHFDELQARRVQRRVHPRARGGPLHAHLVFAEPRKRIRITTIRSSSRRSPAPSTRNSSPTTSSNKRPTRRCAPTCSTARSTTCAARSTGRRCSRSSRSSRTRWRKRANPSRSTPCARPTTACWKPTSAPKFTLDPELDIECLRIPHFYNAFYVYKYATGISAAVALAQKVLHGGPADLARLPRVPEIRRQRVPAGNPATGRGRSLHPRPGGRCAGPLLPSRGGVRAVAGLNG